jgi:hypothetical protein
METQCTYCALIQYHSNDNCQGCGAQLNDNYLYGKMNLTARQKKITEMILLATPLIIKMINTKK